MTLPTIPIPRSSAYNPESSYHLVMSNLAAVLWQAGLADVALRALHAMVPDVVPQRPVTIMAMVPVPTSVPEGLLWR